MLRIAVFVSGRGSNLRAILEEFSEVNSTVQVLAVISDKTDCGAFEIARVKNIPTFSVSAKEKEDFLSYDLLEKELQKLEIELIVLAGFMKKIPDKFIDLYPNKIINIHPALLPSFGGKGMYGMNVHDAVFASSAQISGPTVHFVNKVYDAGLIIAQRCVDISKSKSPEEIAEMVLKVEHQLLPFVIKKISEEKVMIEGNRVLIED